MSLAGPGLVERSKNDFSFPFVKRLPQERPAPFSFSRRLRFVFGRGIVAKSCLTRRGRLRIGCDRHKVAVFVRTKGDDFSRGLLFLPDGGRGRNVVRLRGDSLCSRGFGRSFSSSGSRLHTRHRLTGQHRPKLLHVLDELVVAVGVALLGSNPLVKPSDHPLKRVRHRTRHRRFDPVHHLLWGQPFTFRVIQRVGFDVGLLDTSVQVGFTKLFVDVLLKRLFQCFFVLEGLAAEDDLGAARVRSPGFRRTEAFKERLTRCIDGRLTITGGLGRFARCGGNACDRRRDSWPRCPLTRLRVLILSLSCCQHFWRFQHQWLLGSLRRFIPGTTSPAASPGTHHAAQDATADGRLLEPLLCRVTQERFVGVHRHPTKLVHSLLERLSPSLDHPGPCASCSGSTQRPTNPFGVVKQTDSVAIQRASGQCAFDTDCVGCGVRNAKDCGSTKVSFA